MILGTLYRSNEVLTSEVNATAPAGAVEFSIGSGNVVTMRVTPTANTLSFGYLTSDAGFFLESTGQSLLNFASATTPYDVNLGVLNPGEALWVSLWFYEGAGGVGDVSAPLHRKFEPDILEGGVDVAAFAASIRPVRLVATLPASGDLEGDVVYNIADKKLYRWNGTAWTAAVPTTDLTGQIQTAQVALAAITADLLAAAAVTTTKIADDAITTPKILAAQITGAKIAAGTITAANILAGTITATEIAALTITGAKIAAETISADKLVANSITAGQIAAGAISTDELAAGAITASKIAATTILTSFVKLLESGDPIAFYTSAGTSMISKLQAYVNILGNGIRWLIYDPLDPGNDTTADALILRKADSATGVLHWSGNLVVDGTVTADSFDATEDVATQSWVTSNFVNVTGDTMTGTLRVKGAVSGSSPSSLVLAHDGTNQSQTWALGQDNATTGTFAFVVAKADYTSSITALTIANSGIVTATKGLYAILGAAGYAFGWSAGGTSNVFGWYSDNDGTYLRNISNSNYIAISISNSGAVGIQSTLTTAGLVVSSSAQMGDTVLFRFGGTSASFPALRNSGSSLLLRKADDSGYADLVVNALTVVGGFQVNGVIEQLVADTGAYIGGNAPVALANSGGGYPMVGYNFVPVGSGNWNYRLGDTASAIQFYAGLIRFYLAASGTSGNPISFTERMRVADAYTLFLNTFGWAAGELAGVGRIRYGAASSTSFDILDHTNNYADLRADVITAADFIFA
jgi:hypothetical protein